MNTSGTLRFRPLGVALVFAAFFLLYVTVFRDSSPKSPSVIERKTGGFVSMRHVLAVAIEAAVAGGDEVRAVRRLADMEQKSKGETKEGVNDPVTAGDMRSHRAMYSLLSSTFGEVKVVSEEHDVEVYDDRSPSSSGAFLAEVSAAIRNDELLPARELTIWIDPLDATKEYTGEGLTQGYRAFSLSSGRTVEETSTKEVKQVESCSKTAPCVDVPSYSRK